ncbi:MULTISPECIES: hypothetical protein [unclassified Nocardia]|uniref:hypothetical protein n=1 Tax=unclassified Nocardia TaxID=2637762 RepID=UPI001CE4614C|nr:MULTISPECIES: hypothetical protein [unclassified Nocardia]
MRTYGTITIPADRLIALTMGIKARNTFGHLIIDGHGIGHHLYRTATMADATWTVLYEAVSADDHGDHLIIAIEITEGSHATDDNTEWSELLQLLVTHGATGEFTHDNDDERWRTRLTDGAVHDDDALEGYRGDTIAYVGQMQAAPGHRLDFLISDSSWDVVITALLTELRSRPDAGPQPDSADEPALLEIWSRRAGIAWTIHPVTA